MDRDSSKNSRLCCLNSWHDICKCTYTFICPCKALKARRRHFMRDGVEWSVWIARTCTLCEGHTHTHKTKKETQQVKGADKPTCDLLAIFRCQQFRGPNVSIQVAPFSNTSCLWERSSIRTLGHPLFWESNSGIFNTSAVFNTLVHYCYSI